jgi:hypothetical protein
LLARRLPVRELFLFFGTALCCACGGGSAGGTLPAPAAATPTPSPNPRPAASSDTFTYAGTLKQTFTTYGIPQPSPSPGASPLPSPTPMVGTTTASVTQKVTVATGQSFAGQSGLVDFNTAETDAGTNATTTQTSDAYVAFVPNATRANGTDVTLVGVATKTSNGVTTQTTNAAGNGVFDELPEVANAQWSESAARTWSETDPSSQTSAVTYAADGSYQESITFPEGGTAAVQTQPDGSGVYQTPVLDSAINSTVTITAPSGGQISGETTFVTHGSPRTQAFSLPVWYPSTPPVLASDAFVNAGASALPTTCNVPPAYATTTPNKIIETSVRLDTVFGELETRTTTSYVASPYGVLCTVVHDDLETYYDYSGQSAYLMVISPVPFESTIVDETLALQSASLAPSSASASTKRSTASLAAPTLAVPNGSVLGARAAAIIAQRRAAHSSQLRAAFQSRTTR